MKILRVSNFFLGVDLLNTFGIRNGTAIGTREETGIRKDDKAYRVVGWKANLSVPKKYFSLCMAILFESYNMW